MLHKHPGNKAHSLFEKQLCIFVVVQKTIPLWSSEFCILLLVPYKCHTHPRTFALALPGLLLCCCSLGVLSDQGGVDDLNIPCVCTDKRQACTHTQAHQSTAAGGTLEGIFKGFRPTKRDKHAARGGFSGVCRHTSFRHMEHADGRTADDRACVYVSPGCTYCAAVAVSCSRARPELHQTNIRWIRHLSAESASSDT